MANDNDTTPAMIHSPMESITVEKSTDELRKELAQLMGSVTEADEEEEPVTLLRRPDRSAYRNHLPVPLETG